MRLLPPLLLALGVSAAAALPPRRAQNTAAFAALAYVLAEEGL